MPPRPRTPSPPRPPCEGSPARSRRAVPCVRSARAPPKRHVTPCAPARRTLASSPISSAERTYGRGGVRSESEDVRARSAGSRRSATGPLICGGESDRPVAVACPLVPFGLDDCSLARSLGAAASVAPPFAAPGRGGGRVRSFARSASRPKTRCPWRRNRRSSWGEMRAPEPRMTLRACGRGFVLVRVGPGRRASSLPRYLSPSGQKTFSSCPCSTMLTVHGLIIVHREAG